MVKLGRGPRRHPGLGRQEPVPLFPPGELPVFGPPPANMRRPMPPPRGLPPMPGNYAPPPPPLPRPHHPPPPPPHMRPPPPMHPLPPPPPPYPRRHGPLPHPPALRPLLQTPVMPPRPLPFMRGRGPLHMARGGGHMKRLGKSMKKNRNKKNKAKDPVKPDANTKKNQNPGNNGLSKDVIEGPWITEAIKTEIEKMNTLKKEAEEKKEQPHLDSYNEQKKKVESMATAAKMEYIGSQPDGEEISTTTKNGAPEQK